MNDLRLDLMKKCSEKVNEMTLSDQFRTLIQEEWRESSYFIHKAWKRRQEELHFVETS